MRWLQTLHEQWMTARKRRVEASVRAFRRDWEKLLDDAGLTSAEERQAAQRDAEKLPLKLIPFRHKPRFIDKIEVPLESEAWLHAQFGSQTGAEAQQAALAVVEQFSAKSHPLLPEAWNVLLSHLKAEFALPHAVEPFRWREANRVEELLKLLFDLTSREWPEGTLIRDASTLIVATSFPTQAVRLLLQKLPLDLRHHHFGDTDPAGWDILRKLREVSGRTVHPFHMHWRPQANAALLTQRDQQILSRLLADPSMTDCHAALHAMREAGNKGDFEQESLGRPTLEQWPFYK